MFYDYPGHAAASGSTAAFWIALISTIVICAIGAAYVASEKGRSGAAWFFLGILMGPVALLMVIGAPADKKEIERVLVNQGDLRRCPSCDECVSPRAQVCKHCRSDLEPILEPDLDKRYKEMMAEEDETETYVRAPS